MAEEIVRIIKVDTKNSGKSIKDLRNEIKSLRTELEKTEVGSEEFSAALKKLTQTQKEYNSVQQQVREMSKTNQQDMVQFASFARNLGKAYSSLNAAIGLFADKNEDVQKAMLRVQRTIQLVQGLDGIAGLVRDIPKVLAGFKNWFNALDPIEKRVNSIAKGINGVDPAKLKEINEYNRSAGNASATASATATTTTAGSPQIAQQTQQITAQNQAIGEQTRLVMALNQARDEAAAKVEALTKRQQTLTAEAERYKQMADGLSQTIKQEGVSMSDLTAMLSEQKAREVELLELRLKAIEVDATLNTNTVKSVDENIARVREQISATENLIETQQQAAAAAEQYNKKAAISAENLKKTEKELTQVNKKVAEYNSLLDGTASTATKAGRYMKSLFSTVGWTVVVSLLVSAVFWVGKYVLSLKSASEKQKEFNAELNKTAVQIQSKQIVALRQLSKAYREVGDSAEAKQKFLKDYADRLKDVGLEIDNVNAAELVFRDKTDAFEQAIIKRSKALAAEQLAMKTYQEAMEKVAELEAERDNYVPSAADVSSYMGSGYINESTAEAQQKMVDAYKERINNQIDEIMADADKRVNKLFDFSFGLRAEAQETEDALNALNEAEKKAAEEAKKQADAEAAARAAAEQAWRERMEQRKRDLEDLKKANEDALKATMTDRTRELWEVETHYDELIELAKKYKQDTTLLETARQIEIQKIIDKYNQQALDDERKRINEQISAIEEEISKIQLKERLKNAKLKEPREEDYQKNWFVFGAYAATSQTFPQIEAQKQAEINYNNEVLANFKERIESENAELKKQLEIVGITGEEKLAIETKIAENEKELSNAVRDTEIANVNAKIKAQLKYQAAVQAAVQVAGSLTGAIANMYKVQAQDEKKSAKEREEYAAKYKGWAKAQAIIDTFAAANAAFRAMADIPPAPAWGIAAAAAAIIAGMANVRAIEQESVVSSTSSSVSGSSVSAPAPLSTAPIEYTRNLVGDKELDEINQPIRCYVLESDISKTQNKVKVTEQNATF